MRLAFRAVLIAAVAAAALVSPTAYATGHSSGPYYGGGHHTQSHRGHYSGSHGSSHKGGHYKNPRTGDKYGHHKP